MTIIDTIIEERYPHDSNDELISRADYNTALRNAYRNGATLTDQKLRTATIRAYAEKTFHRAWDDLNNTQQELAATIVDDVFAATRAAVD